MLSIAGCRRQVSTECTNMATEVPTVIDERCFTGEARRRYVNPKNYVVNIIDKYDREFADCVAPTWREWLAYALKCFWKCKNARLDIDRLADRYRAFIADENREDYRAKLNEYFGVSNVVASVPKPEKNAVLSLMSEAEYRDWLSYEQQKENQNGR